MKSFAPTGIAMLITVAAAAAGSWQSPTAKNFPSVGGNLANHRHSSLTGINKNNIARLGAAWTVHLEDGKVQHYQVVLKIGFTIDDTNIGV